MPQLLKFLRYFLLGRAQRILGAQALTALLLFGFGTSVWTSLRTDICEQEVYIVKESDLCVWNPPVWVSDNFVAEALELRAPEARTETLNSLDPNLVDNLLIAFESHPWVEKVESIEVRFPARVDVKLKYKTPIAVIDPTPSVAVDLSDSSTPVFNDNWQEEQNAEEGQSGQAERNGQAGQIGKDGQDGRQGRLGGSGASPGRVGEKYVVDAKGYRLPDDYFRKNPSAFREFPVVLGIRSTPVSGTGPCGDPLVVEAAAFADFLTKRNAFEKLGVDRIIVAKKKGDARGVYCLKTKGDVAVLWGRFGAPQGNERGAGENPWALQEAKLKKLFLLAKEYSSLDAIPAEVAAELDLSAADGAPVEVDAKLEKDDSETRVPATIVD